jgi:PIN domain nuclease of toxin-antitoxin system
MASLLDTHALIWWLEGDPRVSQRLRERLSSADEDVFVSAASAWEIATKARLGKLAPPKLLLADFPEAIETLGFLPLPIDLRHGQEAGQLPGEHRDPFDRMLAAQSRVEGLTLVSADPAFKALGVAALW